MPSVPDYSNIKKDFGKWQPDKTEKFNMRYWKAKKSSIANQAFKCSSCKKQCHNRKGLNDHWLLEH